MPRGVLGEGSLDFFESGALNVRPPSLIRLDLELLDETVFALVILGTSFSFASVAVSTIGCGFRAWATARGPAHRGNMGRATLARTKLASTVTGSTFSLILSCRAVSAKPNTMC